jgi:magnesium-transporting ATPase (P-type)
MAVLVKTQNGIDIKSLDDCNKILTYFRGFTPLVIKMVIDENYKHMSVDDVIKALGTSKEGLSSEEAGRRLKQYGPNEIPEKKVNPLIKFLSYFWGPIPWMIEIAAVLSAVVKHWTDFGIILTLLALMESSASGRNTRQRTLLNS